MGREFVPIEPVSRLLRDWRAETGESLVALAERVSLACDTVQIIAGEKNRKGKNGLKFDVADRIVCRTFGPMAWHTREDMREVWETINLFAIDVLDPECHAAHQEVAQMVKEIGRDKTAAARGVSIPAITRALKAVA